MLTIVLYIFYLSVNCTAYLCLFHYIFAVTNNIYVLVKCFKSSMTCNGLFLLTWLAKNIFFSKSGFCHKTLLTSDLEHSRLLN